MDVLRNPLSGKFSFKQVSAFAWPTIVMLVFMSLYSMVDGAFVANLIGTDALSAVNLVFPLLTLYFGIGIMLATGSAAIVGRKLGEGDEAGARRFMSFILIMSVAFGVVFSLVCFPNLDRILLALGANAEILPQCRAYAWPLLFFVPAGILQTMFQSYFVTAGRPGLGMITVMLGGVTNIVLDYVFIALAGWGLSGAAFATGIGYCVPAVAGLVFFAINRKGALWLIGPRFDWRGLAESCINGSSEMVTNLSAAIVTYLFNLTMMQYLGVDGVAAITIVLYAEFCLSSIYYGFSAGVAPLFSYQFGRGDSAMMKRLFANSLKFVLLCAVAAVGIAFTFSDAIVSLFAPAGSDVFSFASGGLKLFSIAFIFMGINIFASALFTALSNGKVSALLSFIRFIFIAVSIVALPRLFRIEGIWLAVPVAEILSLALSVFCLRRYKGAYSYA
ncbi:MAG: polysaccharide biosynthesis C-terminal domain-containing protein [Planctomycetes bacterium]|nr:polysaccharide biosynthesis C-terminal domain-containing protein [Planctomycetota bacterium]